MNKEKEGNKEKNIFDSFVGKYALLKTLRFSLIPVLTRQQELEILKIRGYVNTTEITKQDKVEKFYNDNKGDIFEADIERKKRYKALKYYLTELHKLFIKDVLGKVKKDNTIDFSKLFKDYEKFESCKDDKERRQVVKAINEEKARLAKYFGDKKGNGGAFQDIAREYHNYLKERLKASNDEKEIKDNDEEKKASTSEMKNILLSQNVLTILREKIQEGLIQEKVENDKSGVNKYALNFKDFKTGKSTTLVEYFDGWSTYFKNFNEIRGNLYRDEGRKEEDKESEGEGKIVKANAGQLTTRIFDENFEIFIRNAVWAGEDKKGLNSDDFQRKDILNGISIFDPKFYIHCFLQTDINLYNMKIAELNKFFNENKKKDQEIKYLRPLFKQLLLTDKLNDNENDGYIEFVDDDNFIDGLNEFYEHSREKLIFAKNFLKEWVGENSDFADIQLNENQLHFFCNKYFGSWSYFRDLYYQQNHIVKNWSKKEDEFRDANGIVVTNISLVEVKTLLDNESRENFKESIKNSWFCVDPSDTLKTDISPLVNAGVYRQDLSNFENFLSFLHFEINSLLSGRQLLSRKEIKDKDRITGVKASLQMVQAQGERVDGLLLSKFSEDSFVRNITESIQEKWQSFENAYRELKASVDAKKRLSHSRDFECKRAINEYCTRVSDIGSFFTLFTVPEGIVGSPVNAVVQNFKDGNKIISLFNAIRNFITKRPDEVEKIKLNFDVNNLLGGWGYKTEEHPRSTDYKCRLYKKNNAIYLGIVDDTQHPFLDQECQMMDYYQLDGKGIFNIYRGKFGVKYGEVDRLNLDNEVLLQRIEKIIDENLRTMFPKVEPQLKKIKESRAKGLFNFRITKEYIDDKFKEKKGLGYDKYSKTDRKEIVLDILRDEFGGTFDFNTEDDYLFNKVKELFGRTPKRRDFLGVDKMVYELTKLEPFFYKMSFNPVKSNSKETKVVALFQIYCQDFSLTRDKNSAKNLHTLYFEELFSEINKGEPIFKLSGGAEIFFRGKIDNYKVEQWGRKDLKNPKTDKLPNKRRRFTEDQILFHVPIVLNNINNGGNINHEIHECIRQYDDIKVLGIDRGEKELAYYCLLDQKGRICGEPTSLNVVGSNIIAGEKQSINYRSKLDIRERERMIARRSWTKIEGIKDLKEGYISNVVNEISRLIINNCAFVCLEELNHGFKNDRSVRIEKGVYQRLEDELVNKLNYLVLEKTPEGVRNALQLTPENRAIKYWGNQMGVIFYTDAKYTSKTCPNCGFRRRGVEPMKTAKEIKEKIERKQLMVFFEKDRDRFRIEYHWKVEAFEFSCEDLYGKGIMEIIYSDVDRDSWNNQSLKDVFKDYLKDNIELFQLVKNDLSFRYADFGRVFNSLTWLRHTVEKDGKEHDRISCPRCHFSTMSPKAEKIKNGDANGAYNIARRGLMIFEKIRSGELREKISTRRGIESKDLKITLKEWDEVTYKQWDKKDWEESRNERGL